MLPPAAALVAFSLAATSPATTTPRSFGPDSGFLDQYAATLRFSLGHPSKIQLTPDGDAVLFLRSGPRSFVSDLWQLDVATRRERVLLTAEGILKGAAENLSVAERARRERQRVATRGIVSYQLSEDGRRILVPLAGRLFVIERASGSVRELRGLKAAPIDPQLSPDGDHVAYARDNDLFVADLATGRERRLTDSGSETLSNGLAEFVAQEEMDRDHGTWWSPDGRYLAYEESDTGPVEVLRIQDPAHPEREPNAWRYPRPGHRNAEVRLGVISVAGGPTTWVQWDRARYPYLAVVRWTRNAPLTLLVQNRRQTEELLLAADPATGKTRSLWVERDAAWLNLEPRMPCWLDDGSAFLWMTERGGARQLELRGRDGRLRRTVTPPSFELRAFLDVDAAGTAWVTGGDDPTSAQLFRVPLDGRGGGPRQVTHEPGVHGAVFAEKGPVSVRSFACVERATTQTVFDAGGTAIAALASVAEAPRIAPRVELTTVGARRYHAAIVRPRDFEAGRRYPVIVSVYGGPHGQVVTRSRSGYLLQQWIADHGFIVVSLDNRGSPHRGRAWERAIKGNLIDVPLADQVEGLRALGARHRELDLTRVGIYGWSFGGYVAAMATLRRPDVFRAGVAGAPVVDWRDYDTYYTERYMGLPEDNPRGYESASALSHADRLERPLLIVHGTVDDNVYFMHSMKLVNALFRAGKPFEFLPLPGFTHMVPEPQVTRRLYQRMVAFFEQNVKRAAP